MSNNNITDAVEEIIDLTDVVSVGNAGEKTDAPSVEDDVLDSLVNDFEKNISAVPQSEVNDVNEENEEKEESDEPLDLSKLDNLINSYNLDFDTDEENQGENQNTNKIDAQNDMDVAFEPNGQQPHSMQANSQKDSTAEQVDFNPNAQADNDIDSSDIPSLEDIGLPSLEEEAENVTEKDPENDIDRLTKDIIDGTDNSKISPENKMQDFAPNDEDSFSAMLNAEAAQQKLNAQPKQAGAAGAVSAPTVQAAASMTEPQNNVSAGTQNDAWLKPPVEEKELKSDMATDDIEEINEDAFNTIFNELSLDHETDEEVVPFAQEVSPNTQPIHLKGDVSFIEAQGKDKANEDIHLVQSASKVLASGEAYLEKFSGEDDSVGAKIKSLSTKIVSLEQRLVGSDSKAQDNALELTYRINGLETKFTELQEAVKAEFITIKTDSAKIDSFALAENRIQGNAGAIAELTAKIQALETRIATLDDIFSEQKMLNDELSKNLDTLMQNNSAPSDNSGQVQVLEERIAALEGELSQAQAKIASLEENIEKAASLAAAKVLREEIIPLLGQ